jgi:hypothetical protein
LVSIWSGFSIGGFDADKNSGRCRGKGLATNDDELKPSERGKLNVEGLPLYRDKIGGIGTPTSDNERTKFPTTPHNF